MIGNNKYVSICPINYVYTICLNNLDINPISFSRIALAPFLSVRLSIFQVGDRTVQYQHRHGLSNRPILIDYSQCTSSFHAFSIAAQDPLGSTGQINY